MIYRFDGTFEGLLSVVFDSWHRFHEVTMVERPGPSTMFKEQWIPADLEKSQRIYEWLKKDYPFFLRDYFRYGYLSEEKNMDYYNVFHVHLVYQFGEKILHRADPYTRKYVEGVRKV